MQKKSGCFNLPHLEHRKIFNGKISSKIYKDKEFLRTERASDWMMINHSTLEYHVTNFNTFFRWLWQKNQNTNTLL